MAEKGFGTKACRKWRKVPLQVMQAEVAVRQAWGQNQGAMIDAWELAPPGKAAQKTAQSYDEQRERETSAMLASFQRMGVKVHLGSDTNGLEESEVGS